MNLKESFRYQKFLELLMENARANICFNSALNVTKTHHRNKANSDVEDFTEDVERDREYFSCDDTVSFMKWLVQEREKLTLAINKAKASLNFDVDAAITTNKFRQILASSIRELTRYQSHHGAEEGVGYKFNVDGNQTSYIYDIDVIYEEAYDRKNVKKIMMDSISKADVVSSQIDAAMINTTVDYAPVFDVNESFDDVMSMFIERENEI